MGGSSQEIHVDSRVQPAPRMAGVITRRPIAGPRCDHRTSGTQPAISARRESMTHLNRVVLPVFFLIGPVGVNHALAQQDPEEPPLDKTEFRTALNPPDATLLSATGSVTGTKPPPRVGPNVQVNAPQFAFPNGLFGRSETSIAGTADGNFLVAGFNDAQGFCGHLSGWPARHKARPGSPASRSRAT